MGLNKAEVHQALQKAAHFHRKDEIRDRTRENQDLCIAGRTSWLLPSFSPASILGGLKTCTAHSIGESMVLCAVRRI
ncbi:MAG: hypothetical protein AAGJ09_01775 [Pseudomonadota bacterium]